MGFWSTLCLISWPGQTASQFPDHTCAKKKGHNGPCKCNCGDERIEPPKPYRYIPGQRPDEE